MSRRFRTAALLLAVVWIVAAFVWPRPVNPVVDPAARIDRHTGAPAEMATLLGTSCFDCHSDETSWPWYTNLFPASLLVRHDVREARAELNMSRWSSYSIVERADFLDEMCEEVREGNMPLPAYVWIHDGAQLSEVQVESLCAWTTSEAERLMGEP